MPNGASLVKVVALLGVVIIFTAAVTGITPSEWTTVRNSIEAGLDIPVFWNPFTEEVVRLTAFAQGPTDFNSNFNETADEFSFVGCGDQNFTRTDCLSTPDGDTSYMQIRVDESALFGPSFEFNYTNPRLLSIVNTTVRGVTITFMCRTTTTNTTTFPFLLRFASGGMSPFVAIEGFTADCPIGPKYSTNVLHRDYPDGIDPADSGQFPFRIDTLDEGQALLILSNGVQFENYAVHGEPIARFTYFRIDVDVVIGTNCQPPDGAWFPAVDEIACAIINFANFVWKALQFIGSGIAFIVLAAASILGFVGGIIVNLFLGTISVYGTLFNLGAPSPVQEFIDVLAIAVIAFLIFVVVSLIRGTEG